VQFASHTDDKCTRARRAHVTVLTDPGYVPAVPGFLDDPSP
jgi:hypothetical protein